MLNSYFKFKYITLYFFPKKKKKLHLFFLTKMVARALHVYSKLVVYKTGKSSIG